MFPFYSSKLGVFLLVKPSPTVERLFKSQLVLKFSVSVGKEILMETGGNTGAGKGNPFSFYPLKLRVVLFHQNVWQDCSRCLRLELSRSLLDHTQAVTDFS